MHNPLVSRSDRYLVTVPGGDVIHTLQRERVDDRFYLAWGQRRSLDIASFGTHGWEYFFASAFAFDALLSWCRATGKHVELPVLDRFPFPCRCCHRFGVQTLTTEQARSQA